MLVPPPGRTFLPRRGQAIREAGEAIGAILEAADPSGTSVTAFLDGCPHLPPIAENRPENRIPDPAKSFRLGRERNASEAQNEAAACHDVVLGARIQLCVQAGIAGEEITDFCPQAKEAK
jgi:hypothetical protein